MPNHCNIGKAYHCYDNPSIRRQRKSWLKHKIPSSRALASTWQTGEYALVYGNSISLGMSNHSRRFLDIAVGWSGKNHDAHVFRNSAVCEVMDARVFIPCHPTMMIPPFIVADGAYLLRSWLMNVSGGISDRRCMLFDCRVSQARNVMECAFGCLKSWWRCLSLCLTMSLQNVVTTITACVILNNISKESHNSILSNTEPEVVNLPNPLAPDNEPHKRSGRVGEAVHDALADVMFEVWT